MKSEEKIKERLEKLKMIRTRYLKNNISVTEINIAINELEQVLGYRKSDEWYINALLRMEGEEN